jgi:RNA polymerase sigma-70 factor (ECF subfamily)
LVDAFFAAARFGDFDALVSLLDADVVLRCDGGKARPDLSMCVQGAEAVASRTLRLHQPQGHVTPVLVNGALGAVVTLHMNHVAVVGVEIAGAVIVEANAIADPERLVLLKLFDLSD